MVNFKKLTNKLSKARDEIIQKEEISPEIEKILESMMDAHGLTTKKTTFEPKTISGRLLTDEQHYRLRLIEKTGTGSTSIH